MSTFTESAATAPVGVPAPGAIPSTPQPGISIDELYRLTVEQYDRLAELGLLDDPTVELIDGLLVRKMTKHGPHMWTRDTVCEALAAVLGQGWFARVEGPVRIPQADEPEPDVAVLRGTRDDYRSRNPDASDVALVVEVAESSLRRDRLEKLRAYARGGIPEYWIVNLIDRVVERYSSPRTDAPSYESRQVYGPEDSVPVVVGGQELGSIAVAGVLP
jgi:Uma2 family endonuclease